MTTINQTNKHDNYLGENKKVQNYKQSTTNHWGQGNQDVGEYTEDNEDWMSRINLNWTGGNGNGGGSRDKRRETWSREREDNEEKNKTMTSNEDNKQRGRQNRDNINNGTQQEISITIHKMYKIKVACVGSTNKLPGEL